MNMEFANTYACGIILHMKYVQTYVQTYEIIVRWNYINIWEEGRLQGRDCKIAVFEPASYYIL